MKRRPKNEPLPTIWRVPDELCYRLEPMLLELDLPFDTGAKRIDQCAGVLDAREHAAPEARARGDAVDEHDGAGEVPRVGGDAVLRVARARQLGEEYPPHEPSQKP